jgi:hypothetical protein
VVAVSAARLFAKCKVTLRTYGRPQSPKVRGGRSFSELPAEAAGFPSQRQYATGQTQDLARRYRHCDGTVLTMQTKTREVLDAAQRWLSAIHAVSAADQAGRRSDPEQAALDTAEVELAVAIMDWRNAGRPD